MELANSVLLVCFQVQEIPHALRKGNSRPCVSVCAKKMMLWNIIMMVCEDEKLGKLCRQVKQRVFC